MDNKEANKETVFCLEEYLTKNPTMEMTSGQRQCLGEFFELCQNSDPDEMDSFWERIEEEPEIERWFESPNVDFDWTTPAAWARKLAGEQRKRVA